MVLDIRMVIKTGEEKKLLGSTQRDFWDASITLLLELGGASWKYIYTYI